MLSRSLTRSRQAQPSGSPRCSRRMTSVQPWSVQDSRRSVHGSPPGSRSRQVPPRCSRRMTSIQLWSVQGSRRFVHGSPPGSRSRQVPCSRMMTSIQPWSVQGSNRSVHGSPPRSRSRQVSPPRSDRDRYGIILCARRPTGQRDRPRRAFTSTGVSASRPPPTASPPLTAAGTSPSTSIKGATARPSRVIPRPSGKTAIKPAHRPADRVSASLGARSSPRSRLSLRGARPSAFDHNAGPLASSTSEFPLWP